MLQIKRKLKILDFDIENRPLSYWYDGKSTAEITAIASCWDVEGDVTKMETKLLGVHTAEEILAHFIARYNEADIVTGHFIRKHDLPIINGSLIEYGFPILEPKLTIDTSLDLPRKGQIPGSQEYLGELFGIDAEKVHMSQHKWRKGNRLTPEGIEATKKRAAGDVTQHVQLRHYLKEHGLLKAPRVWKP